MAQIDVSLQKVNKIFPGGTHAVRDFTTDIEHGEFVDTATYAGEALGPGMVIDGPAVVELPTTTIVVFPGHVLNVNAYGDFHIEIPQNPGSARAAAAEE